MGTRPFERQQETGRRRVPELDGIRGLAILAVLAYHLQPQAILRELPSGLPRAVGTAALYPIVNLGWAGVNLFFVLSGFLITGILLETKGRADFFQKFYVRRIVRIFPAYYATLFVLFVVLPIVRPALAETSAYHQQIYFWTYLQNWLEAFRQSTSFQSEFLGHMWSLAIEEQFYLFWPLVVFALSGRRLEMVCVGCVVGALLLRLAIETSAPSSITAYDISKFSLPTNLDGLAFGALIACFAHRNAGVFERIRNGRGAWFALAALLVALLVVLAANPEEPMMTNPLFRVAGGSLLGAAFAILITKSMSDGAATWRRLLRISPLTYCGTISYGLYLYHWPIFYVLRQPMNHGVVRYAFPVVALGLSFALAVLSFRVLETPMLGLGARLRASESRRSEVDLAA